MKNSEASQTGTNFPGTVDKYLQKYSLAGWHAEHEGNRTYNNIAVIPAIKEYNNIGRLIQSLHSCDPLYFNETLFLFVINNTVSAENNIIEENSKTINYLKNIIRQNDNCCSLAESLHIGLIDASSEGFALPDKDGGVGFARKLGMDIALTLFNYNNNRKKIIICLDADCTVDNNYLTQIVESFNKNNFSAGYVCFEHPLPDEEEKRMAIICYEVFLRYYVLGLVYAKSGYAIHTIGSTMICDYESYIKAEGMNKKKAAEDFYFMEKLCKNFTIHEIKGTKIYPSSRGSWRVPFGTGQRVNRFLSKTHDEYLLYSPESFDVLKQWLEVFNSPFKHSAEEYLNEARNIHPALYTFLVENKFQDSWKKIEDNCKNDSQLIKQKHFWFDGFRTLKLIHYLRDNGLPQIEMYAAVEILLTKFGKGTGFTITSDYKDNIEEQRAFLQRLRELA